MSITTRNRLLAAAAAVAAAITSASGPETFLWPVALEPGVSSSFCDYRDGRFHAGIDVRTYGSEGIACVAVGDGWVSRIRASSRGYGKAIHLTLDSGLQVMYAHLAEFVPVLEDTLWVEQQRAGRYSVDVALPPARFRVRRGDILAYSGSTGAVAPHLHFEVRTLDDEPLNPLLNGIALSDRDPPSVARIAFVPLSSEATVEGATYPLELEPRRVAEGRYRIDDTLRFSGDVGVAATVVDRLNNRSGRLTPKEIQVWSDGTRLARVSFERFRFDEVRHVDFALDMGALRGRGTDIYTLYERAGDPRQRVEFVRGGRVAPAPSTRRVHDGRVVALDAAGNRTEVVFVYTDSLVTGAPAPRTLRGERWRTSHLAVDDGGDYFQGDFAVVLPEGERHLLTERARKETELARQVVRARDLPLPRTDDEEAPVYHGVAPANAGTIELDERTQLAYPADAVYGEAVVFTKKEGDAHAGRQRSLRARSSALRLGPVGFVFKRSPSIRFRVDAPSAQDGVFRASDAGGPWSFLATTADSAGVSASVDRPGVFAVFRDEAAPWLGTPKVVVATSYANGAQRNEIHVPVDDEGAGFDDARTEVFVGGSAQIWRWELAAKKIVVTLRDDSIIGPQPVRVVAFDRLGNSASVDATVTIEARSP